MYRQVIDEVIAAIKPEFDEYGVSEDVLADLQHVSGTVHIIVILPFAYYILQKWQSKVVASRVADFEPPPQQPAPHHTVYPPHAIHMMQHHPHYPPPHNTIYTAPPQQSQTPQIIKPEPVENRYILSGPPGMPTYALPPLPGPQLNGMKPPTYPGGQQGVLSFPPHPAHLARSPAASRPYNAPTSQAQSSPALATQTPQQGTSSQTPPNQTRPPSSPQKIPQADGPSSSYSESPSPPPSQSYAPRPSHPSLPQPSQMSGSQADSEAINSDLDDSDTEGDEDAEEGGQGDTDIVFCTYDKVRISHV